jgi:S-adenosylmethionine uptake transporter
VITILWTIPLFALVLSKVFLKEHVTVVRWIATIVGFLGLAYLTLYDIATSLTLKWIYIVPTISAFLFAVQDVMIKKMVLQENRVTMLLYFAVVASLFAFPPAILVWKTPTVWEISLLLVLGLFANLIQYFIFKAFESADLSALAPYRYIEFLISALAGFIFFLEIPGLNVVIGATILIPSTLYLAYTEESNC